MDDDYEFINVDPHRQWYVSFIDSLSTRIFLFGTLKEICMDIERRNGNLRARKAGYTLTARLATLDEVTSMTAHERAHSGWHSPYVMPDKLPGWTMR